MRQYYAHKRMASIRDRDSKIELLLRKALRDKGYRFKVCAKRIIGKPDIVFVRERVAVFCDSLFWHGRDWHIEKHRFKRNKKFWCKKIENNMERDYRVNRTLEQHGWRVLRFWEDEILRNVEGCVKMIKKEIKNRRNSFK